MVDFTAVSAVAHMAASLARRWHPGSFYGDLPPSWPDPDFRCSLEWTPTLNGWPITLGLSSYQGEYRLSIPGVSELTPLCTLHTYVDLLRQTEGL